MNNKPVIFVTRQLTPAAEARLRRDYSPLLNTGDRIYSEDEFVSLASGADAILSFPTDRLTARLIGALPARIRAIASFAVGTDHIDLEAARERGLVVTNTPDVLSGAVAEIAVLLVLGAARRAAEADNLVRTGNWRGVGVNFMLGTGLQGKRLGILGMGRIGRITARRLKAFDMEIHYHNRRRLDPDSEGGAVYHPTLAGLLGNSDVLSIHCPATEQTRGLLGRAAIARMPDKAIVVNTARGEIIDDDALVAALRSGKVRAAGLDVFNGEPRNIHPGYRELANTFLLPHIGSATEETRDAMGFRAIDNLDAIFAGREPADRVA